MDKYEFCYVTADSLVELKEDLNEAGRSGWRCVGFQWVEDNSANHGFYDAILERKYK